jgi:hypothetical protein
MFREVEILGKNVDGRQKFPASESVSGEGGQAEARLNTRNLRSQIHAAEAAAAARLGSGDASPSQRTETSFETPGSCIVTP